MLNESKRIVCETVLFAGGGDDEPYGSDARQERPDR